MTALTNRYEDDDASHLPPGMKRVGYDADTERYTFREGDDLWLGEPGSLYGGQLKWAGKAPEAVENRDTKSSRTERMDESSESAIRTSKESSQEVVDDSWGVPVASISDTGAQPPDDIRDGTKVQAGTKKLKRVATTTVNALGIFNRRPQRCGTRLL